MADENFDILIRLQAELAGATESVAALKELKRQAIASGVSTGDLDKQIAAAERTTVGFQKKVEVAGAKGEAKIQGLHSAFRRLGNIVPGVGNLIQAAVSLPALGVTALAVGLGLLVEKFAAYKAKIEEAAKAMDELNLAKLTALRDATAGAATEMAKFNLELARAGESSDPLRGRKFSSEQEELNTRVGMRGGLDTAAQAALAAAEANKQDPVFIAAQADLKKALAEEAKLRADAKAAGTPEQMMAIWNMVKGTQGSAFAQGRYETAVGAAKALATNQELITSNQALVGGFGVRQSDLDARAGRAGGFATSNRSRILSLQESVGESERQRRAGITQQMEEGGVGFGALMPGAGAAAVAVGSGMRASPSDARDFNLLMQYAAQNKAGKDALMKLLMEVFKDGIVTPEEIARLKANLDNKSTRP